MLAIIEFNEIKEVGEMSSSWKEVNQLIKKWKEYANPKSSFDLNVTKKHIKVEWFMKNENGEDIKIKRTLPKTPSDYRWVKTANADLKRLFREKRIN